MSNVIRIPFRSDLSREDDIALEAATEWILTELENGLFHLHPWTRDEAGLHLKAMRAVAEKELLRPRDAVHRRWAELFIRETNEIEFDNVRPEIRKLAERGNVTVEELASLRCNSWEWELLIPKLNDEAFIKQMQHALVNCSTGPRPFTTYDKAVCGLYGPGLLKRFSSLRLATKIADTFVSGTEQPFRESKEAGSLNVEEMTIALKNIGFDLSCGACAELFYTGSRMHDHDERCFTNNEATAFAEVIDNVRAALGQESTHYLVIADDIKELVDAVERESPRAKDVLRKIRAHPGSGNHCQACSIEAEIGTEENPHPVPKRFHTCDRNVQRRKP